MSASAVVKYLLSFRPFESQSIVGGVRLGLTILMVLLLVNFDTGRGRPDFTCDSEANDELKRQCFSKYTGDMSSLFLPKTFVLITAGALFVLWISIIGYSHKHLEKIRGKTDNILRKQLCHELWEKSLLHVCIELALVIIGLIFFSCTQEISLPETYNCTVRNVSKEIVLTCEDLHYWDKSKLNYTFIFMMLALVVLCIFDAMRNKEHFIKDLLNLNTKEKEADDDNNHHRNAPRNDNDGSGGLISTSNHSEQPDAPLTHKRRNTDAAATLRFICLDLADYINFDWKKLGGHLLISPNDIDIIDADNPRIWDKTMSMLNTWRQRHGKGATVQVLRKALEEIGRTDLLQRVEGSSWQSGLETSPNLTETTPMQTPPQPESPLISNTIRRR